MSDYNSIRCAIIQPAVPTYRSEFFDDLRKELSIDIYASDIDFLGVHSDNNIHFFKIGRFIKFFSLFWHSNLPIFKIIKNYIFEAYCFLFHKLLFSVTKIVI